MTLDEVQALVLFMQKSGVAAFKWADLAVTFEKVNQLQEVPKPLPDDILRQERELADRLLFGSSV